MEANDKNTSATQLHDILQNNIDAHRGYGKAAELAQKNELKQFFSKKSGERKSFVESLQVEMENHYKTSDENGSLTGSLHRTWMDIKSFFRATPMRPSWKKHYAQKRELSRNMKGR